MFYWYRLIAVVLDKGVKRVFVLSTLQLFMQVVLMMVYHYRKGINLKYLKTSWSNICEDFGCSFYVMVVKSLKKWTSGEAGTVVRGSVQWQQLWHLRCVHLLRVQIRLHQGHERLLSRYVACSSKARSTLAAMSKQHCRWQLCCLLLRQQATKSNVASTLLEFVAGVDRTLVSCGVQSSLTLYLYLLDSPFAAQY